MRFFLLILAFCMYAGTSYSQIENWDSAGVTLDGTVVDHFYVDTAENKLYASGILFNGVNTWQDQTIAVFDGSNWSSLGSVNSRVFTVNKWDGELIVGGFISEISGVNVSNLARFDGVNWHAFGNFNAAVRNVKIIQGDLYAMGDFDFVDGVPIQSIAKWNGSSWVDVNGFTFGNSVYDALYFNNELYLAGNFVDSQSSTPSIIDLAVYKNGQWQRVGEGFYGGLNQVNKLIEFQDDLYAAGLIQQTAGNVGSLIQKWDGVNWTNVATGLQGVNNDSATTSQVFGMRVIDNELYVCGNFSFADHVPAAGIAKWDGTQWCGFGTTDLISEARDIIMFEDTLFVGLVDSVGPLKVSNIAKWIGGNYVDSCGSVLGVVDHTSRVQFKVYPNPAHQVLNIEFETWLENTSTLALYDLLGREVLIKRIPKGVGFYTLKLSDTFSGIYFLQINGNTEKILIE